MPHAINIDNLKEATSARRDILFMYVDMIESYGRVGSDVTTGGFDPLQYVSCYPCELPCSTIAVDTRLLEEGSIVKLLCWFFDAWDQFGTAQDVRRDPIAENTRRRLESGGFSHLPLGERALKAAIESSDFADPAAEVYTAYVLGYFERLLQVSFVNQGQPIGVRLRKPKWI